MDDAAQKKQARTLLSAVERLVMSNEDLRELVAGCVESDVPPLNQTVNPAWASAWSAWVTQ